MDNDGKGRKKKKPGKTFTKHISLDDDVDSGRPTTYLINF